MKIAEIMYGKLSDSKNPTYKHKVKNGKAIENTMTTELQNILSGIKFVQTNNDIRNTAGQITGGTIDGKDLLGFD